MGEHGSLALKLDIVTRLLLWGVYRQPLVALLFTVLASFESTGNVGESQ